MPPDFTEEPAAFLPAVTDADTRAWALAVHRLWAQLCWQARAGHCAASSGHHATALLKGGHTATVLLEEVLMQDQSEHVQMQAMWDTRRRTTSAMPLGSGAAVHSMRTRQQASSINPSRPQLCMQTGQDWGTHRALPRHGPGHSTTSQVQCPAGGGERGVAPGAPQPAATAAWGVVPGARFREVYYWDSLWAVRGLLASGMHATAQARCVQKRLFQPIRSSAASSSVVGDLAARHALRLRARIPLESALFS